MKLKDILNELLTRIFTKLPGGELRRCEKISNQCTDCIRHLNHLGKCEDAWGHRWRKDQSL